MTIPVILASQSPSRRRLLVQAGIQPTVRVSGVDEPLILQQAAAQAGVSVENFPISEQVSALAKAKAGVVADELQEVIETEKRARGVEILSKPLDEGFGSIHSERDMQDVVAKSYGMAMAVQGPLIVGCDSIFEFDGQALGKPHSPQVAEERLMAVRGKSGNLWTGHCLIDLASGQRVEAVSRAKVTFGQFTREDMRAYIATGEPLEVAGSFTLEGLGSAFIDCIEGDPSGVVGLSLPTLRSMVESLGLQWTELWNAQKERERAHAVNPGHEHATTENVHQPGDGWVNCACSHMHWGLNGAAGVLLSRIDPESGLVSDILLQHRAEWSAEGGTWGVPGGAIANGESPIEGALRESFEEANIHPQDIGVVGSYVEDHGPWSYTTVFAIEKAGHQVKPRMNDDESLGLEWVPLDEVGSKKLLKAFERDWPEFHQRLTSFTDNR